MNATWSNNCYLEFKVYYILSLGGLYYLQGDQLGRLITKVHNTSGLCQTFRAKMIQTPLTCSGKV